MPVNTNYSTTDVSVQFNSVVSQQWWSTVKISSTDFRTFRHEILIAKHVRACRHGILAPGCCWDGMCVLSCSVSACWIASMWLHSSECLPSSMTSFIDWKQTNCAMLQSSLLICYTQMPSHGRSVFRCINLLYFLAELSLAFLIKQCQMKQCVVYCCVVWCLVE